MSIFRVYCRYFDRGLYGILATTSSVGTLVPYAIKNMKNGYDSKAHIESDLVAAFLFDRTKPRRSGALH